MILKNTTIEKLGAEIKANNRGLILFGAGTMLTSWISYVLKEYGITDNVALIVDNSPDKWGKELCINGRNIRISSPERFYAGHWDDAVILITSSYFAAIIEKLDAIPALADTDCYVALIMHITEKKQESTDIRKFMKKQQNIPKVIHYCWFGKTPMSEKNRKCMESWKKYCPDYEIVEWNEDNYDVYKNTYMGQAYDAGKYAYVSDYARIDILYGHGGIYLDTDVELLRNMDELLHLQAFTSFEEYPTVNFGGGSGSVKGFPLLKNILDFRENIQFIHSDGSYNTATSGYFETVPLQRAGLKLDGGIQNINGLTVLSSEYFHPKSSVTGQTNVTGNTYAVHQFSWSWADGEQMKERKKTQEEYGKILRRMQGNASNREQP